MLINKSSLLIMSTHVRFYISCSPFLSNGPALFPFLGLKISSNIRSGNLPFVFSIFLCPSFVTHHPVVHCFLLIMSAVSSEAFPQSSVVLFFSFLLIYLIVPTWSSELFFSRILTSLCTHSCLKPFLYPVPKWFQFLLGPKIREYAELEGTHDSDDSDDSDDLSESSSPTPGHPQVFPRVTPCVWEYCPNASSTLSGWCCDQGTLFQCLATLWGMNLILIS